jgi:uncharacterized protein YwgA
MVSKNNLLYLIKKLGINIHKLKVDTEKGLEERIKLQKIVFLTKRMGIDFNYDFSLYLHGPYSKDLSNDYYSASEDEVKNSLPDEDINELLPRIEKLYQKETPWLEVATTILDIKDSNKHLKWKDIISYVSDIKSSILVKYGKTIQYVESVLEDLRQEQLIFN